MQQEREMWDAAASMSDDEYRAEKLRQTIRGDHYAGRHDALLERRCGVYACDLCRETLEATR